VASGGGFFSERRRLQLPLLLRECAIVSLAPDWGASVEAGNIAMVHAREPIAYLRFVLSSTLSYIELENTTLVIGCISLTFRLVHGFVRVIYF